MKVAAASAVDVGFAAPELLYTKAGASSQSLVAQRADAFRLLASNDINAVNASRNDDVRVRVLQIEASLALTSSMNAWSNGNREEARTALRKAQVAFQYELYSGADHGFSTPQSPAEERANVQSIALSTRYLKELFGR